MSEEQDAYQRLIQLGGLDPKEWFLPDRAKESFYTSELKRHLASLDESFNAEPSQKAPTKSAYTKAQLIDEQVEALLEATLAGNESDIDAAFSELFKLGVGRDRGVERILYLWAERNGWNLSSQPKTIPAKGRVMGQAKGGKGLRQQIPGFGLDRDLHLLVADAGGGKTTAACELATVYTARDRGFLDHEAPRTDPADDPRDTVLILASDGEGTAYDMWDDYFCKLNSYERGAKVEIWAQDDNTGEQAWNMSLPNLHRLAKRVEQGDIVAVIVDTADSVFRGAGINTGIGPIETYLRLLKKIVCRHAALWLTHHTNRSGQGLKAIGGHPAFQEVPSVIHMITVKDISDDEKLRQWHVLKLRGQAYRRFAYDLKDGQLQVIEGHYFQNCSDEVLGIVLKLRKAGISTKPAEIAKQSERPRQSISNAISDLRSRKLLKPHGIGYEITKAGLERLDAITL